MWHHAQYLRGELPVGEDFATWKQAEHWVVRTLHVVSAFYQDCWLLFSSPFAVLLSWFSSCPTREGEGVREWLRGSLLQTEAKPQQRQMRRVRNITIHFIMGKYTSNTPLKGSANSVNGRSIGLMRASLTANCITFSNYSWAFLCIMPSLGAQHAVRNCWP